MKKIIIVLGMLLSLDQLSVAQNVGIGTANPQSTLDVRGNLRAGGNSNFIDFDSLSGKITWTNSNLWITGPQYLMKHSASAEGLFSNGSQLEYRNQLGNPSFFTNWSNGNGYFSGNLGIGTISPTAKLQIRDGSSGITPFFSARMVMETNSHTYINLLSPDPFETGILFGSGTSATSGVISYNTTATPKGFTFSDNGNLTRMVIDNAGNVGIGTTAPSSKLEITHNGASVYGTALLINQNVIGNSDGPKIQFKKTMTASKSWTAGILNGVNVGTFAISEDGGTSGFGTPRFTIAQGGNIGIGTVSPAYPLDITSDAYITGNFTNTASFSANVSGVTGSAYTVGGYGIGVAGYGGSIGIDGESALTGTVGTRTGAYCLASNGNYAFGVYSHASGGATASYAGYFAGDVYCSGAYLPSDRKLKTGIQPLNGALSIINQLNPSVYTYRTNEYKQMQLPAGIQYGLIADEVQQVIPGIVKKAAQPAMYEHHDERNGKKLSDQVEFNAVNYIEIIPVLVAAVKEQQAIITSLQSQIAELKKMIGK